MQVPVYNTGGEVIKNIEISEAVFGVPMNESVVHQAMVKQRAGARQGTSDTKGRGEVAGSGKKMYAQKHTGEARAGDKRSPTRRHGGVAFGPHPRDYSKALPRKMRQLALRCLLSSKIASGNLRVLEGFSFEKPKTKEMIKILDSLKLESSTLIVTAGVEGNMVKSARNIPGIKTLPAHIINVIDLLSHVGLVMTEDAVRKAEQIWGEGLTQEDGSAAI
ncbi:MAG TPA: 50S ribosomal protein L4 [Dehalococcoidales bacterium]|nr:50S ribosomal protein L4 [Dehalococcoidales bacterium]